MRQTILEKLNLPSDLPVSDFLSLYDYVALTPQKFYSEKISELYSKFLVGLIEQNSNTIKHFLVEKEREINIAVKSLRDINNLNIHDNLISSNEISRIQFIDKEVHYIYQRLIEGPYHTFIYPIAYHFLKNASKGVEKMDVFNCYEIIKKTEFSEITKYYDHHVRNSIAHNDFVYYGNDTKYKSKGQEKTLSTMNMIRLMDNMLDVCNAMCFALKSISLMNVGFLSSKKIKIPKQIVTEELIAENNTYEWEIQDLFESVLPDGRKQLNIYGRNSILGQQEALYYTFRAALKGEKYLNGYDRYYVSSDSKYAYTVFAGLKGEILKRNRIANTIEYQGVYENLFFMAKIKVPRFLLKIRRMLKVAGNEYKLYWKKHAPQKILVRWAEIHRNKNHCVVNSSILLNDYKGQLEVEFLRNNLSAIIRKSRKSARRMAKWYNLSKYLRSGVVHVTVYSKDFRRRKLKASGLIPELLCTIEFSRLKRVKTVDIIGSKVEQIGKYRIAWNSKSDIFENLI